MKTLGLVSLLIAFVHICNCGTFFVATNGVDTLSKSGSIDEPWATLSYANSRIASGDVVMIREGTYADGWSPKSGTTWRNYSNEQVVISTPTTIAVNIQSASDVMLQGLHFDHCYRAIECQYSNNIEIRECTFQGISASSTNPLIAEIQFCDYVYCIKNSVDGEIGKNSYDRSDIRDVWRFDRTRYALVDSCDFAGATHYALMYYDAGGYGIWNVVRNSTFHDSHGHVGLHSTIDHCLVERCFFDRQYTWHSNGGAQIHIHSDYSIVRYNVLHHNSTRGIQQAIGDVNPVWDIYTEYDGATATHNHIYHNTVVAEPSVANKKQMFTREEGSPFSPMPAIDYNVIKNNIMSGGYSFSQVINGSTRYLNWTDYIRRYPNSYTSFPQFTDSMTANILACGASTRFFQWGSGPNGNDHGDIASNLVTVEGWNGPWRNNMEADATLDPDLSPGYSSAAIDAAAPLTWTSEAISDTNSVPVNDANYFFPGFPSGAHGVIGDSIKVGSEIVRITAINGNTLTVNRSITINNSGVPVYYYASDKLVGSAPDIGALERHPFAYDACLMAPSVLNGNVGTMTVHQADANYFLVAIGIADSSVRVDSCYIPGATPILGDSILRVEQREASIDSPGVAIQLFQIKHPGMWAVPVRVHLTGPADFAWGVITMKGVQSYRDPTGARHTAKGLGVRSVSQNYVRGPNFFWVTMLKTVSPGTGVSVLASKTDLRGSSKAFSILRKATEDWTAFSYSKTDRGPLAAGGVEVFMLPNPPTTGEESAGGGVLTWVH